MLSVNIICVGKLKEKYLSEAMNEYAKRLSAFCKFSVIELEEAKLPEKASEAEIDSALKAEGKKILSRLSGEAYVIAMCIEGKMFSSRELSELFDKVSLQGKSRIDIVIGSSYGLCDEVKRRASLKLSVSLMTFPHQLFRVMLSEQVYRAFQISYGGKYHK